MVQARQAPRVESSSAWNPRHAWLAAVLPADARTFRSSDPGLAGALRSAGGQRVDASPDVELGGIAELRGDATCAIAVVDRGLPGRRDERRLWARAAIRIAASASLRLVAARMHRRIRALGYVESTTLLWDVGGALRPRLAWSRGSGAAYLTRFPLGAVVVGRHGAAEPTIVDAAREAAAASAELVPPGPFGLREAGVVVVGGDAVLRVAVGPARLHLGAQQRALEALAAATTDSFVHERVPALLATGEAGLGGWMLETRLPGRETRAADGPLLDDCVEFLAALFRSRGLPGSGGSIAADAETVARAVQPELGVELRRLGERLEERLEGIVRGVAHGDFHVDNLLTREGRLTGVFDWEQAAPEQPPLHDLFHLLAVDRAYRSGSTFADAYTEYLLPLLRAGGDDRIRTLARAVGVEPDPATFELLATAGWLRRSAYQLETYSDRVARPVWLRENVAPVVEALIAAR
jgi:hypothetical protein